jgi:hypothetical protein
MYIQYFENASDDIEDSEVVIPSAIQVAAGLDDFGDLGVGKFSRKSPKELEALLGWPRSRPPIFAEYRSRTGRNEWNDNKKFSDSDPDIEPLALLWHQMCGVTAIVDKIWTRDEEKVPGIFLADAVGLGKTAQVMAVIAMIIQVWMAEKLGREGKPEVRPPVIGKLSYYGRISFD